MAHVVLEQLKNTFHEAIIEATEAPDMPVVWCKKDSIVSILQWLRDHPEFCYQMLTDITVVDFLKYPTKQRKRFAVVYIVYSIEHKQSIRLKVPLGMDDLTIDSVVSLWKAANWLEREAYDMYGVKFNHHPNLKRILTHHEFVGHPLRKDYPVDKRQVLSMNDSLWDEMEKQLEAKGLKV